MLVNEYALTISSGATTTTVFQAGRAEYYAGFTCSKNFGGHIHLEESFYPNGPFRVVYDSAGDQIKWNQYGSGIFVVISDKMYHPYIRFSFSGPVSSDGVVYLRTVEE